MVILHVVLSGSLIAQQLQLHFEPRHELDATRYTRDFVSLFFQYFKPPKEDSSFVRVGSTLIQTQCDFTGVRGNIGKLYVQCSQTVKFWAPNIYLDLEYSGGLGIAEPGGIGFYITNTYSVGWASALVWQGTVMNLSAAFAYTAFKVPSRDFRCSVYWWRGLFNYAAEFSGDIQCWTLNKNLGSDQATPTGGKWFCVFAEPQFWYSLGGGLSLGTKINVYYNVVTFDQILQIYPTAAVRYKF